MDGYYPGNISCQYYPGKLVNPHDVEARLDLDSAERAHQYCGLRA